MDFINRSNGRLGCVYEAIAKYSSARPRIISIPMNEEDYRSNLFRFISESPSSDILPEKTGPFMPNKVGMALSTPNNLFD